MHGNILVPSPHQQQQSAPLVERISLAVQSSILSRLDPTPPPQSNLEPSSLPAPSKQTETKPRVASALANVKASEIQVLPSSLLSLETIFHAIETVMIFRNHLKQHNMFQKIKQPVENVAKKRFTLHRSGHKNLFPFLNYLFPPTHTHT